MLRSPVNLCAFRSSVRGSDGTGASIPPMALELLGGRDKAIQARVGAGTDSSKAHGRNFFINGTPQEIVQVWVSLGKDQVLVWCERKISKLQDALSASEMPLPTPVGVPGRLGPAPRLPEMTKAAAASATPSRDARWQAEKGRVSQTTFRIEELQPFRLVGEFCEWQLDVRGLVTDEVSATSDGWHEHHLLLVLKSKKLEFQIVSDPLGFKWRLFPSATVPRGKLTKGQQCMYVLMGGPNDGHGANFCVEVDPRTQVLLRMRLKAATNGSGVPIEALLTFDSFPLSVTQEQRPKVEISDGRVKVLQKSAGQEDSWSSHPDALQRVEPLYLVGEPCQWRLEQRGLDFVPLETVTEGYVRWRTHKLCFRMLTLEVKFQIVSKILGFRFRLFPAASGEGSLIPKAKDPTSGMKTERGGKDDGHGMNFNMRGAPLTVVNIFLWLEEIAQKEGPIAGQAVIGYQITRDDPKVAIAGTRVHCPPRTVTLLGPELLELAQTQEEQDKILEMRW